MNKESIFAKDDFEYKMSMDLLVKTIPDKHYFKQQTNMSKELTEWRWRFLNLNGKKMIEISRIEPGKGRVYINNKCDWVERKVSDIYDKYVKRIIYAYLP